MTIQDLSDITSFKWAAVTANSPLRIKMDGDTAALAITPDSLVDPLTLSVGDRVRVELSLRKIVVHGVANGAGKIEAGRVQMTARAAAPGGWLLCQGQSLLRTDYPALFAAIGGNYGAVDSTHFNIPDARGRTVFGLNASVTQFNALAKIGGAISHLHAAIDANMGAGLGLDSTHSYRWGSSVAFTTAPNNVQTGVTWSGTGSAITLTGLAVRGNTELTEGLPPFITMNYMIKI